MPTVHEDPHRARDVAESFGVDPERYDRARPRYPDALVERVVAASPGGLVLDVGCGTGIAARRFQAAGCTVLGVDPDPRMADRARGQGLAVDVATFEEWDPAGRTFDAVVSGMTWHWVDPVAGARKAAQVLRPGGRIALFWYVLQPPPDLAEAFTAVYRRLLPGTPLANGPFPGVDAYSANLTRAADGMAEAGGFGEPERWRFDWDRAYDRDGWLEFVPTAGGFHLIPADTREELLAGLGAAVDAAGGGFTMHLTAIAVSAVRAPAPPR
jgi:SAM-dependent methyltransferase